MVEYYPKQPALPDHRRDYLLHQIVAMTDSLSRDESFAKECDYCIHIHILGWCHDVNESVDLDVKDIAAVGDDNYERAALWLPSHLVQLDDAAVLGEGLPFAFLLYPWYYRWHAWTRLRLRRSHSSTVPASHLPTSS